MIFKNPLIIAISGFSLIIDVLKDMKEYLKMGTKWELFLVNKSSHLVKFFIHNINELLFSFFCRVRIVICHAHVFMANKILHF